MAHSPNYNPRNGSSASGRGGNSDAPLGSGADLVIRGAQNQPDAIQSGSQNTTPAVLGPPGGDEAAVRPGTNSPHSLPVVTNGTHDEYALYPS
jgi:hypothetical protein